jgi:plastocyanin
MVADPPDAVTSRILRPMKPAFLVLFSLLLLGPACGGDAEPQGCVDPVPATTVELADFAFRPECLTVDAGATITLDNVGESPHTFTVDGTDLDLNVDAGSSAEAGLSGIEPGRYAVTCTYHAQMTATLTVA